ncbi:MAG: hypothetical protein P1V51_11140 [Deltaproteobacteria bacterium]|nr:hypothetical protein [Deltaproteobacteria bacterium]
MRKLALLLLPLLALPACGPADVAGEYTISVTNRENECGWSNWTEGDQTTGVPVTVTQDGNDVTAVVGGLTRVLLDPVLGGHTFSGEIHGDGLDLTLYGTRSQTQGNCTYTTNANLLAEADGDVLTGEILYTEATNGNPDCDAIAECVTRQVFNGTRPPQ